VPSASRSDAPGPAGLRRDLGTLESYAALIGILIGAGIFKVTSDAWALTGPSVILGHVVLAPAVLATSVAYCVYLSTPLGREPGGEYTHISRTFGGHAIAFVGAWLKIISYIGALAYLASAFAGYVIPLLGRGPASERGATWIALAGLVVTYLVHVFGVRWFGRVQVAMCALLGLAIVVLVLPGLWRIEPSNYRPFFTHGAAGFFACLPPIFFAYAGFESLAQAAGEVKESQQRLPWIFLKGLLGTTLIYLLMTSVAFGALPGERLKDSPAPMVDVASAYLGGAAVWFVNLGAVMALTTSLNSTMLVPSRLAIMLARDGLAPRRLGAIHARTGTPVIGLSATLAIAAVLLLSGQVGLTLNIAVFALVLLYLLHSVALLLLPRWNPALDASVTVKIPRGVRSAAAWFSVLTMAVLVLVQLTQDLKTLRSSGFSERVRTQRLTTVELSVMWAALGAVIYRLERRRGQSVG
jgi:amino acid transporter